MLIHILRSFGVYPTGHLGLLAKASSSCNCMPVIFLAMSLLFFPPLASAQSYIFNRADYPAGSGAVALKIADLNRDGRPDAVVANTGASGGISILLRNSDATFASPSTYPIAGGATNLALGDLNGDQDIDVLVVSGSNGLIIFLGNGDGSLQQSAFFTIGQSVDGLALADLNGDGKLDLVL